MAKETTTINSLLDLQTHTGHKLTLNQLKFIDNYIASGNVGQAVKDAGYKVKNASAQGRELLSLDYIKEEVKYRLQKFEDDKIATAEEVLKYFTSVMRGEIKDQFGLDAPLSERTKAAQELAKRFIDTKTTKTEESSVKLVIERKPLPPNDNNIIDVEDFGKSSE